MSVREDIINNSDKADVECLLWLFNRWHMSREWFSGILVNFEVIRYGIESYKTKRRYSPTKEGRLLFDHRSEL